MNSFEVFLVEDNVDHAHLATQCMELGRPDVEVHHFQDGPSVLAVLRHREKLGVAMPNLLLLDLNMPGMDGFQVLEHVKGSKDLRRIPTVVVSTSKMVEDMSRAQGLHANSYTIKSMDFDIWERSLKAIRDYWCDIDKARGFYPSHAPVTGAV